MSDKKCLLNHCTDVVETDESKLGFLTFTQHRFFCLECRRLCVVNYVRINFPKKKEVRSCE